jgi:hypothetical protein
MIQVLPAPGAPRSVPEAPFAWFEAPNATEFCGEVSGKMVCPLRVRMTIPALD